MMDQYFPCEFQYNINAIWRQYCNIGSNITSKINVIYQFCFDIIIICHFSKNSIFQNFSNIILLCLKVFMSLYSNHWWQYNMVCVFSGTWSFWTFISYDMVIKTVVQTLDPCSFVHILWNYSVIILCAGVVYHFDSSGVQCSLEGWRQCLAVPVLDVTDTNKINVWSVALTQFCTSGMWGPHTYVVTEMLIALTS